MGLYMTKTLVEQFNGEVSVVSELARGSTFSFTFYLTENTNKPHEQNARLLNPNYPKRSNQIRIEPKNEIGENE